MDARHYFGSFFGSDEDNQSYETASSREVAQVPLRLVQIIVKCTLGLIRNTLSPHMLLAELLRHSLFLPVRATSAANGVPGCERAEGTAELRRTAIDGSGAAGQRGRLRSGMQTSAPVPVVMGNGTERGSQCRRGK